jgi:hypothetical protein
MFQNLSGIREDLENINFPDITKQALSKARHGINPNLFKELFYLSVDLFYKHVPSRKTWNGYHIFAIDGSKFELPNSKSNFDFFGEMFCYPDPNRRFTMGLASMVYDVLDDYIIHASLQRYLSSEREVAKEHMAQLEALNIYKNSILIFDRGYYSENMFRYCTEHGHLCLMRLKEGLKISQKCKKCNGEFIAVFPGINGKIELRVIEVTLSNGTKEYLATNLMDPAITPEMFRELYFYRWPVETKYQELKSRLKIEEFNGATTTSIFQEFYINMLFANLSSLIKNDADEEIESNSKPTNKYRYQANRTYIIGRIKKCIPRILCGISDESSLYLIYKDACRNKSQIIPDRSSPRRKNKTRGRLHFRNRKVAF